MADVKALARVAGQVRDTLNTDKLLIGGIDYGIAGGTLTLGTVNATALSIGSIGVTATVLGNLSVNGIFTIVDGGSMIGDGDITLGGGDGDTITLGGSWASADDIVNIGTVNGIHNTTVNLRCSMGVGQDKRINFDRTADSEGAMLLPDTKDAPVGLAMGMIRVTAAGDFEWYNGAVWATVVSTAYTLDDAYDASLGASTITVDAGDVSWNLTGAFSFNIDASAATGIADGFQVNNGTDFFRILRTAANTLDLSTEFGLFDVNSNGEITVDSLTAGISLDGVTSSNFTITANSIGVETIQIHCHQAGVGTGNIGILADDDVSVTANDGTLSLHGKGPAIGTGVEIEADNGGGAILIGCNLFTNQLSLGGAGARAIYVGHALATSLNLTASQWTASILVNDAAAHILSISSINAGAGTATIDIDADDAITIDSTAAGISLDAVTASNFSVSGAALTLSGVGLDLNSTGAVTVDATAANPITIGGDANTGAMGFGTAGARTITVGNITGATGVIVNTGTGGFQVNTTGAGTVDINGTNAITIDAATGLSLDGVGASNLTATSGTLTLSTLIAGTLIVNSIGLLDIDAAANIDMDVTGTFDLLSTGTFSIDGTGASNVTASSGNLTLSTLVTGDVILSSIGYLVFKDAYYTASTYDTDLVLSDNSGEWDTFETNFGEVSLLNALNQCASTAVTLDEAYNAGVATITVDAYDVTWNLTGAFSHVTNLAGCTGVADGFFLEDGTDYFRLTHAAANTANLSAELGSLVIGTSLTCDINSTGAVTIDAAGASAIIIGGDANTGAIGIGTGASVRTITLGNATGATAVAVNTGTGDFLVNATQLCVDQDLARVGINIAAPAQALDVYGKIASNGVVVAWSPTVATDTLIFGTGAPSIAAGGDCNTLCGIDAGAAITTAQNCTFVGYRAGYTMATGTNRNVTAVGYAAGYTTTGIGDSCFGVSAGQRHNGSYGTFIGALAGYGAAGNNSGYGVHIGYSSGYSVGNGATGNVFVGSNAGYNSGTGTYQVHVGYEAGKGAGAYAGADFNVCIGYRAGYVIGADADSNVMLGPLSGSNHTTGDNQLYIANAANTSLIYGDFAGNKLGLCWDTSAAAPTLPAYDLSLWGSAAREFGVVRHATADTAGNALTIRGGGATVGATNKAGGNLNLYPGVSTGSGTADTIIYAYPGIAAAAADNTPIDQVYVKAEGVGIGTSTVAATLDVFRSGTGYAFSVATNGVNPWFHINEYGIGCIGDGAAKVPYFAVEYNIAQDVGLKMSVGDTAAYLTAYTATAHSPQLILQSVNDMRFEPASHRAIAHLDTDQNIYFRGYGGNACIMSYNDAETLFVKLDFYASGYNFTQGPVGIGGTATYLLDVFGGDINIAEGQYYRYGAGVLAYAQTALHNYYFGSAGNLTTTGTYCTVGGDNAGIALAALAHGNTMWGASAGYNSSTGTYNTYLGMEAGYGSGGVYAGSNYNTAVGYRSGYAIGAAALSNTLIGSYSGENITDGDYNVLVGYQAGGAQTTITGTVAVGAQALQATTGTSNTALGFQAGIFCSTGVSNVFVGYNAGFGHAAAAYTLANENVCVGSASGYALDDGASWNTFLGTNSAFGNTTGNGNTCLGYSTGHFSSTGINNVFIGYQAARGPGGAYTAADRNVIIGYRAGYVLGADADQNTVIGSQAGYALTAASADATLVGSNAGYSFAGNNLVAVGASALYTTTGAGNSALGYRAGLYNSTGTNNTFLGFEAGFGGSNPYAGADGNTCVGYQAGYGFTGDANNSTLIGCEAGKAISTADYCVCVGSAAGRVNTTTDSLVAVGTNSLYNTTGAGNTGIGHQSGYWNATGTYNTFLGYEAGFGNGGGGGYTSSDHNVCVGYHAGYDFDNGSDYNTLIGSLAGENITSGDNNVCLGYLAAQNITTGSGNVVIGNEAGSAITTGSNLLYVGNASAGLGSTLLTGDFSTASIGIGMAPTAIKARLHLPTGGSAALSSPLMFSNHTAYLATPEMGAVEASYYRLWYTPADTTMRNSIDGTIYAQTATKTISNSNADTSLVQSGRGVTTMPAGYLALPGNTIRVTAGGTYSTVENPGTITLSFKIGATVVCTTGAVALTASMAGQTWRLEAEFTLRTTGASGTFEAVGHATFGDSGLTVYDNGAADYMLYSCGVGGAGSTVNTTGTLALDLREQFSVADAGNIINCTNLIFEYLD